MNNKIVNIVNFVRGREPRDPELNLVRPVIEEIALNKKYNFPNTFLLQYDTIIDPVFQDIFRREQDENMEIGIWFECVRQLVEACGIKWRGADNVTWDWHVIPGFLMAYNQEERQLLIDEFMKKFKEVFGHYPDTVGSWLLDSWSVTYMQENYDIKAFLMCREQYGVDAYTVWGGYYNQGYYPARNNIMCPAQSKENSVGAPVFKMLGIDPIYGYDENEFTTFVKNGCATMEPVWEYGYTESIFKSYLDSYYDEECMDFAYATVGQENSFGWEQIKKGLPMQLEEIAKRREDGEVIVQRVCDTGKWFKSKFDKNPCVSLISHNDWADNGLKSIWFSCENYRANLFFDNGKLYFRDINKFDEKYDERYFTKPCDTMTGYYDNLPVVDGRLWNGNGIKTGLKFATKVSGLKAEKHGDRLVCTANCHMGDIIIELCCDAIRISKPSNVKLYFERGRVHDTEIKVYSRSVEFTHCGFVYEVGFDAGLIETPNGYEVVGCTQLEISMTIR